ncbi:MAG: cupin domain-containing protein [Planctomycetes bacterium]|nr:cupin domain-containing protein [Planctomycetota bacterium]MBL7106735.1 cupin domain-containing protein [Phycisphaerae bacterium]
MPTVKDVIVRKPTEDEKNSCEKWPIWECQPSTFDWSYTQTETCLLIEGKVTVKDNQSSIDFGAGDYVIFPNGLECTWQIREVVKKYYNFS